jgi:hypothetical protein
MSSQHTTEDDRPERDLERIANDSLDSIADDAREAAKEHLRAYNDTLEKSGKPFPKKGKAAAILRELIAVEGYSLSENHLIQVSETDYITSSVAALRDMGWIIESSRRFVRGSGGRNVQKTCYSLDHKNNRITFNS